MTDDQRLQYTVTITGHMAPFKWSITNPAASPASSARHMAGESDSYSGAMFDAGAVAQKWENERIHRSVIHTEVVLDVPVDVERSKLQRISEFDDLGSF